MSKRYQWEVRTLPSSWRWAVRPWWGPVRKQGRQTDCVGRSECLLGAVGLHWTPKVRGQHERRDVDHMHDRSSRALIESTLSRSEGTMTPALTGLWVSRSVWLGSSWTGLTAWRPTLSPPLPLAELRVSHRICWLYFTPGIQHKLEPKRTSTSRTLIVTLSEALPHVTPAWRLLGVLPCSGLGGRLRLEDEAGWLVNGVSRATLWRKASSLRRLANQLYTRTSVTRLEPSPASWEGNTPLWIHSALREGERTDTVHGFTFQKWVSDFWFLTCQLSKLFLYLSYWGKMSSVFSLDIQCKSYHLSLHTTKKRYIYHLN